MSVPNCARRSLSVWGFFLVLSFSALGQSLLRPQGPEYCISGGVPGDQVFASVALTPSNGVVVWEDNYVDRTGSGIGSARLNNSYSPTGIVSRVNNVVLSHQNNPKIAYLQNGEMICVWDSRVGGNPDVYARLTKKGKFFTNDFRMNGYIKDQQVNPAVTSLPDGSAVVAWSSFKQDGSYWGVYARRILAGGTRPKPEFCLAQNTAGNQRDVALASLANGSNFVAVWVSEKVQYNAFRGEGLVDASVGISARIFSSLGSPVTDEISVSSGIDYCALPAVAALPNGGFTVVWGKNDIALRSNSWDIVGRSFNPAGQAESSEFKINGFLYGDQFRPQIAASPAGCMVVWTSLGQDGSREGVYARFLEAGKQISGDEIRVNTKTASQQLHPAVAWNGVDRFIAVWSSYAAGTGFDLFAQAFFPNSNQ